MWTAKVDPKQSQRVTHRVAFDLSTVSSMPMTGMTRWLKDIECRGRGGQRQRHRRMRWHDVLPTGDFNVWQKLPSQDMSGTLNLADGTVETWDVKDVGFVNYFSLRLRNPPVLPADM